jgi:hypothetical protein
MFSCLFNTSAALETLKPSAGPAGVSGAFPACAAPEGAPENGGGGIDGFKCSFITGSFNPYRQPGPKF